MNKDLPFYQILLNRNLYIFLFTLPLFIFAQPGSLDMSTLVTLGSTTNGFNNRIMAIAEQDSGKFLVGGIFNNHSGTPINRFTKINYDGSIDNTFNTNGASANGYVKDIILQDDGKIIIAGAFSTYNNTTSRVIARLHADGTLDPSFSSTFSLNFFPSYLNKVDIQDDGKIIIAGSFDNLGGSISKNIARLNADGSVDGSFNSGVGTNGEVKYIAIQDDGKIIIVGDFTDYNGTTVSNIARINPNGTIDNSFSTGVFNGEILSVKISPNQQIIIGGLFYEIDGNNIVGGFTRLNTNGSIDNTLSLQNSCSVNAINLQDDGSYILGGTFNINGFSYKGLYKMNANGNKDPYFQTIPSGFNSQSIENNSLLTQSNGNFLVGSSFAFNGQLTGYLTRFNATCQAPITTIDSITTCNLSFTWTNGITYSTNNYSAKDTFISTFGCDSIVTLNLTIDNTVPIIEHYDTTICQGDFVQIYNYVYSQTNNYTRTILNKNGCDSLIFTLNLTVNPHTSFIDTQVACNSYTWIDGNTYDTSNYTATYTISNSNGCDSTILLHLTINNNTMNIDTQEACNSFTWIDGNTYYSSNNTATYTISNSLNCDSIILLNLTLNNSPINQIDTLINQGESISIGQNTYSSSGTYTDTIQQVNKCDSIIVLNLDVQINTGIQDNNIIQQIRVFPNPTSNILHIEVGENYIKDITLFDLSGKQICTFNSQNNTLNLYNIQEGIYVLRLQTDTSVKNVQIRINK